VRSNAHAAELRAAVHGAPSVLGKFAQHRTMDRLKAWASKREEEGEQCNAERAARILTVKKDGPDEYRIYANNDEVFEPMLIHGDRGMLRDLAELRQTGAGDATDLLMRNLDRNGEVTLIPAPAPGTDRAQRREPFVFNPLQDDRTVVEADRLGRYGVTDRSGVLAKGWVFPKVVTFEGKATGLKIFAGRALSAMQHRIAGIRLNDEPTVTLPVGELDAGRVGTLVSPPAGIATVPFTIVGVTVCAGERSLAIVDYAGARINLVPSARVDGIVPLSDSKALGPLLARGRNYLISDRLLFVPFAKLTAISDDKESFRKVAADEALDTAPLKVSVANGRYVFRGSALSKYAASGLPSGGLGAVVRKGRNLASQVALKSADATRRVKAMVQKAAFDTAALERHEAAFLLASWGLGQDKTAHVLDAARAHVVLEVHHLRYPSAPLEKTAAPARQAFAAKMRAPMAELVKVAALLEDADTVDSILALGFVSDENLERFASVRPLLEDLSGTLAKLLLGARLGIEDIPEEAARSAIASLQRVIDGLVQLEMQVRQNQARTSTRGRGQAA
jgi:hypothetical protein